jgi:hypothetical protein
MASNYIANTSEPLVPRPNSWNTNETWRTNYAAVAHWLPTPTWNANCWLTNAATVFACASIDPGWGGTLVSPSIFIAARHVGAGVGATKYWLTPAGTITSAVVAREIILYTGPTVGTPDIVLGVLDRPMPTNMIAYVCSNAQFLAAFPGSATRFGAVGYVQAVSFDQHYDAALLEISKIDSSSIEIRSPLLPASATLSSLHHSAHPGDSSRPIFLLWGNKPVLLCTYFYATYGSSIPGHIADIDAAVQAEGESLRYINFEEVP